MYVCLFVCMLGREVYKDKKNKQKKTGHPTFEWEVVFCREVPKKKKKQYFAVREMLPNKM